MKKATSRSVIPAGGLGYCYSESASSGAGYGDLNNNAYKDWYSDAIEQGSVWIRVKHR